MIAMYGYDHHLCEYDALPVSTTITILLSFLCRGHNNLSTKGQCNLPNGGNSNFECIKSFLIIATKKLLKSTHASQSYSKISHQLKPSEITFLGIIRSN